MKLKTEMHKNQLVVTPTGPRLDAMNVLKFKESMRNVVATSDDDILLDMHRINFLDSSGLGVLVGIQKLLADGRAMHLANITPLVAKVFELTHMGSVFVIHDKWPAAEQKAS